MPLKTARAIHLALRIVRCEAAPSLVQLEGYAARWNWGSSEKFDSQPTPSDAMGSFGGSKHERECHLCEEYFSFQEEENHQHERMLTPSSSNLLQLVPRAPAKRSQHLGGPR